MNIQTISDWRHADSGLPIGSHGYADQPNLVKTDDGAWLCVMTVGAGEEGEPGQHVISMRSTDRGQSWSEPVAIEPASGPEASWAVACKAPSGRIFVFYVYNADNLRRIAGDRDTYPDGYTQRVDSLGYFVYRWSDDHGRSWSSKRVAIPVRQSAIDRNNATQGKVRLFWNVSSPQLIDQNRSLIVPLHKVAGFGRGFFTGTEGWFVRSDDLLGLSDPSQATWDTLPDGDVGLTSPQGPIAEEQSITVLSDGTLYCTYRTIDGYACHAYSRDGGHTWTPPAFMVTQTGGQKIKHPRAANFVWKVESGLYLYWHHNHGVRCHDDGGYPYQHRNPVWVRFGREISGPDGIMLHWSEPEIILYDDQHLAYRFSYPDLLVEQGEWYFSQTQKTVGRIHCIDPSMQCLGRRWAGSLPPLKPAEICKKAAVVFDGHGPQVLENVPALRRFSLTRQDDRPGLTVTAKIESAQPGLMLSNRDAQGNGFLLCVTPQHTLNMLLVDGKYQSQWESDVLPQSSTIHIGVIVDAGPKIISFIINGQFCDGGQQRQFGWGRYDASIQDVNGSTELQIGASVLTACLFDSACWVAEVQTLHHDALT